MVWYYYRSSSSRSVGIAGCLCFYNEKVNVEVDGVMLGWLNTMFLGLLFFFCLFIYSFEELELVVTDFGLLV
ncbi:hypothetical protein GGR50DRAFT_676136 [Xylaria sp. CBS 124048]|nr:hypothetical protein GGR50DRAFT_676136 [Xylaria sp. CBS 124048]